ncbi:MAG: SusF/SusE family outer membrane protein [Paludibacter sp.]
MKKINIYSVTLLVSLLTIGLFTSCDQNLPDNIAKAGPLALTASKTSVELNQKNDANEAIGLTWTTGTNKGTGASISYTIQIDKKGNNFSKAIIEDMGKGIYAKSFTVGALNDSLLTRWGCTPGTATDLEARVISTIYSTPTMNDTSAIVTINVTPYQPVSKTLYLFGTASPKGTDLNNALKLTAQSDPTVFIYQGALNVGTLKFITTLGQELPSYNMGADSTQIVKHTTVDQTDNLFTVRTTGVYKVIVSLLDLSVSIAPINYPAYGEVYIFGSAAPNGTDLTNATKLSQSSANPFVFTYQGVLKAGSFKFPVNRNSDGNQDMFMRTDDTHFYIHQGGSAGDDQWTISKKGYYTITLNQLDNTVTIYREKLFMVGSATPIGWTITNSIQMTEDPTDGCIFTYSGPMVAGEFKLPVNRNSDWGQDMYMKTDDTHMYRHIGGQADDKKWSITASGNYLISANIETLAISFVKQ